MHAVLNKRILLLLFSCHFITRLNKNHLAQKRVTVESPVVINLIQVAYVLRLVFQSNDAG